VRKIISFTHATLDGYIDDPHKWSFPYSDEELQDYGIEMTLAADALLLGRITYEGMAQAWPPRGGDPFANHVNSITSRPAGWSAVGTLIMISVFAAFVLASDRASRCSASASPSPYSSTPPRSRPGDATTTRADPKWP
jgi:dihydrofolate reductase